MVADGTDEEYEEDGEDDQMEESHAESPVPKVVALTVRKSDDGSGEASMSKKNRRNIISRMAQSKIGGGQGSDDDLSHERDGIFSRSSKPKNKQSTVKFPLLGRSTALERSLHDGSKRLSKIKNSQIIQNRYGS